MSDRLGMASRRLRREEGALHVDLAQECGDASSEGSAHPESEIVRPTDMAGISEGGTGCGLACRMRKRLLSRSMPLPLSSSVTSPKLLLRVPM